jgi:hypothetical protein
MVIGQQCVMDSTIGHTQAVLRALMDLHLQQLNIRANNVHNNA